MANIFNYVVLALLLYIAVPQPCNAQLSDLEPGSSLVTEEVQVPPNILLIIADDMGIDSSVQYNVAAINPVTPNLDKLAKNGLVFDNVWVNPVCAPARASMITGKYGFRTNVRAPGDILDSSEITIQKYIRENSSINYAKALIGKWHLSGGDQYLINQRKRYGSTVNPLNSGVEYFSGIVGNAVGDYFNWTLKTNGVNFPQTEYATTVLTDEAISWIDNQKTPWFLWLAFNAPHVPFHLPPTDLHSQSLSGTKTDIANNPLGYYLASIEAMDSEIGRFLDSLSPEERNNTVIFFIGDNGTPRGVAQEPFDRLRAKGSLYEGGIRVPMIASGKGVTRVGQREEALINGTDFFASIAELTGIDVKEIHDSKSFVDLLSEQNTDTRDFAYAEIQPTNNNPKSGWALRNQQYKLINFTDGTQELYDIVNDPFEHADLLLSDDQSNIVSLLESIHSQLKH